MNKKIGIVIEELNVSKLAQELLTIAEVEYISESIVSGEYGIVDHEVLDNNIEVVKNSSGVLIGEYNFLDHTVNFMIILDITSGLSSIMTDLEYKCIMLESAV